MLLGQGHHDGGKNEDEGKAENNGTGRSLKEIPAARPKTKSTLKDLWADLGEIK